MGLVSLREDRGSVESGLARGSADVDRLRGDVRTHTPPVRVDGDITDIRVDLAALGGSLESLRGSAASVRQAVSSDPNPADPALGQARSAVEEAGPQSVNAALGLDRFASDLAGLQAAAPRT